MTHTDHGLINLVLNLSIMTFLYWGGRRLLSEIKGLREDLIKGIKNSKGPE